MGSDRWVATGDDWELGWTPAPPHLIGTPRVVERVESLLARQTTIAVTPTGPVVPSEVSEPLAVWAVLRDAAGSRITLAVNAPLPPPLPEGTVG